MQPIELRVPRRHMRDLCDALVNGVPPLPIGDEPSTMLSEMVMEDINETFSGGSVSIKSGAGESIELMQEVVSEDYLYFPTTLTLPKGFRDTPELMACYSSITNERGERIEATDGRYFDFKSMGDTPGSAVAVYSSDDGVTVRVLMHRLAFLVHKLMGEL